VAKIQLAVLQCLALTKTLEQVREYLSKDGEIVEKAKRDLRNGRVPPEELVISQRLSQAVEHYKSPSPAAWAAQQMIDKGMPVAPGQVMHFVLPRGGMSGVWALGCGELDGRTEDVNLLNRAVRSVLDIFAPYSRESPRW
jgi:DNA polymerase elongation subunit (family B)